jgi:hypothetical protein
MSYIFKFDIHKTHTHTHTHTYQTDKNMTLGKLPFLNWQAANRVKLPWNVDNLFSSVCVCEQTSLEETVSTVGHPEEVERRSHHNHCQPS